MTMTDPQQPPPTDFERHQHGSFHGGEVAAQTKAGVAERMAELGPRFIRPFLPEQHRAFYEQLPFVVVAARDTSGRPWVSLLSGMPGFITSPDPKSLGIAATFATDDALAGAMQRDADVGFLGIEFATRRRNRINGRVADGEGSTVVVAVDQTFGNCPQYIREREWMPASPGTPTARRSNSLTTSQIAWVRSAETFFVGTGHRGAGDSSAFGMDASHRGGSAGFVSATPEAISWPEYSGNNHFNTIGNLLLAPAIGLLFVDFETGRLLQLTGTATVEWGAESSLGAPNESVGMGHSVGPGRRISVQIDEVVELDNALAIRWAPPVDDAFDLTVTARHEESPDVVSVTLTPLKGSIEAYSEGQYLPIQIPRGPGGASLERTYSLTSLPTDKAYRVTVKRLPEGVGSGYVHSALFPGAVVRARPPAGDFTLQPSVRPVVLLSAGVGVTPMLGLLNAAVQAGREVWFFHSARDGQTHLFRKELEAMVGTSAQVHSHVWYSQPRAIDQRGEDFDDSGRMSVPAIDALLPSLEADFYVCGPAAFMASLIGDLRAAGVLESCIFSEAFGA